MNNGCLAFQFSSTSIPDPALTPGAAALHINENKRRGSWGAATAEGARGRLWREEVEGGGRGRREAPRLYILQLLSQYYSSPTDKKPRLTFSLISSPLALCGFVVQKTFDWRISRSSNVGWILMMYFLKKKKKKESKEKKRERKRIKRHELVDSYRHIIILYIPQRPGEEKKK